MSTAFLFCFIIVLYVDHSVAENISREIVHDHIAAYPISTIYLNCNVTGTNVMWIPPWHNLSQAHSLPVSFTMNATTSPTVWRFSGPPHYFLTEVTLFHNATLVIHPMRGAFLGLWKCEAQPSAPDAAHFVTLVDSTHLGELYLSSLFVGLLSLAGALSVGVIVGTIRYIYEQDQARHSATKPVIGIIPVPVEETIIGLELGNEAHPSASLIVSPQIHVSATIDPPEQSTDAGEGVDGVNSSTRQQSAASLITADIDLVFSDPELAGKYVLQLEELVMLQGNVLIFARAMRDFQVQLKTHVTQRVVKMLRNKKKISPGSLTPTPLRHALQAPGKSGTHSANVTPILCRQQREDLTLGNPVVCRSLRGLAELSGSLHMQQNIAIVLEDHLGSHTVFREFRFE